MLLKVLVVVVLLGQVYGFPTYPGSCLSVVGDNTGKHSQTIQNGANAFTITSPATYSPGGAAVAVSLTTAANSFAGFLLWAEDANGVRQGTFTVTAANTQTGAGFAANTINAAVCNNANGDPAGTLGHNSNQAKTTVTTNWTPPASAAGTLIFKAYVVENLANSFNNIASTPVTLAAAPATSAKTTTSAANVVTSASKVATSANKGTTSASKGATSAANAATSATSAANAATSAANAATSAANAVTSASNFPVSFSGPVNNVAKLELPWMLLLLLSASLSILSQLSH